MKRILMTLAVLVLAVFALTACATGTEEVGTATAAAAQATGDAAAANAAATALVAQGTSDAANVTIAETAAAAQTVAAAAVADAQSTADAAASALPATDVPTVVPPTDIPATDVPTDVPATDVPTDVPATDVPATEVPTEEMAATLTDRQIRATARAESAVVAATEVPTEEVAATEVPTEEVPVGPGTLVDVAVANPEFSTLVALVQAAGLVDVLSNPDATFTVFAPTNDAFAAVPAEVLAVLGADPALLTRVLTYHVLGEIKSASELVEMASAATMEMEAVGAELTGSSVTFTVAEDGTLMVDAAKVIIADVVASNGVIHAIDAVLVPADIAAMLAAPAATEAPTEEMAATEAPTEEMAATEVATEEVAATEVPAVAGITSVCLVTDLGRVNDGTFNQYAYEGMVRAAEDLTIDNKFIETQAQTDYETNIATCVDEGFDAIVTVGFLIADATAAAAAANPNVSFIGVDQFHANPLPNLVGIQFREDQAGFLVGALAAQLSVSGKIAGVYGIDIPPVKKFRNGFEQGAKYINPDIEIAGVYIPDFVAPQLGAEAAEQFVADGFDVIFGAGGPTGSGGIVRAAELGAMVIGVDQDEWVTTFGSGETPGADKIISSALKRVDQGVYDMIAVLAAGGALPDSSLYLMDAAVNGVGFAPAHDATISEEIVSKVQEVFTLLASGELSTGVDPVTGDLLEAE